MLHLAVRMAGHRIAALLAVACAVLGGAALITATGVLAESGLRSQLPADRLAGADVVVSTDQNYHPAGDLPIALPERGTVPAKLVSDLSRLPGVTKAVGDVGFPAALVDARGRVVPSSEEPQTAGHGWSSTGLLTDPKVQGDAPARSGEVAVDSATARAAGVRVGDRVRIVAVGRPAADYRLSAVVDAPGAGILFADTTARRLSGSATVDLVALRTEPGAEGEVAAAAREKVQGTGLTVTTGADRGDIESPGAGAARPADPARRFTGRHRAADHRLRDGERAGRGGRRAAPRPGPDAGGGRNSQANTSTCGHTGHSHRGRGARAGRGPRLSAGRPVPRPPRRPRGIAAIPPLTLSPIPAVATILLLAGAVQVSARGAAWRTSRMPATEAVAESRSEPRTPSKLRTNSGLLLIVAATALSAMPLLSRTVLGATATSLAGILGAIGLALAGPALVKGLGNTAARRLRPGVSAPTWLAVSNIRGYAMRLAGVVSALAMAVVFVLTYTFAQTTVMAATADDVSDGTLAQHRLTAPGLGGLPSDALTAVRDTDGVTAAAPVSSTTVVWPYKMFGEDEVDSGTAMILTPDAGSVLDLDVRDGDLDRLTGNTVAVSSEAARTRGAELGRTLRLVLGDGTPVTARVVAVYERGLGFGSVALSHDLARNHTTAGLDQSVLVRTDGTEAAERSLAATAAAHPGLLLAPTDTGDADGLDEAPPEVWVNLAVIVVLLGYLLLSIANKLVATTAQRRNEIATLRLNGTTPRQILAMMRREAAVIATAAVTTGVLLSAIPLTLLGIGFLERPWPAGPAWLLPGLAALVVCTAFLTVELPTRQALRTAPADALSVRE